MSEFEQLARVLRSAPDEDSRLRLAVHAAVSLVARCSHAGITINEKGGLLTRVSSDDFVSRANELQYELGEGPCLSVRKDQDTMVVVDLATEERWPVWAPRVLHEFGASSMMSLLVFTEADSYGALSLYAVDGQQFNVDDVAVAQTLAGHLALSMSAEREIDQLGMAIVSRLVIGRAEGILMEKLDVSADQAFDYLRRISSQTNRKLVAVASDIARTRMLPNTD
ncbi:GAF and ANTAR domain-containing protein [Nocardioides sp.]|uniref:GAF and ANTAR domain-containing protein n=1 Tax=Nocardioides sp. TaxID=35761 RepID=UPI0026363183|nr:GAF and ANTAR domain-containing protein [Nocardioides sp.]